MERIRLMKDSHRLRSAEEKKRRTGAPTRTTRSEKRGEEDNLGDSFNSTMSRASLWDKVTDPRKRVSWQGPARYSGYNTSTTAEYESAHSGTSHAQQTSDASIPIRTASTQRMAYSQKRSSSSKDVHAATVTGSTNRRTLLFELASDNEDESGAPPPPLACDEVVGNVAASLLRKVEDEAVSSPLSEKRSSKGSESDNNNTTNTTTNNSSRADSDSDNSSTHSHLLAHPSLLAQCITPGSGGGSLPFVPACLHSSLEEDHHPNPFTEPTQTAHASEEYRSLQHFLKKEFIEVEEAYVAALDLACEEYLRPLMAVPGLQGTIVNDVLGSLYNIKACNVMFLKELRETAGRQASDTSKFPYSEVDFGPACLNHMRTFRSIASYFALYEQFCTFAHKCDSVDLLADTTKRGKRLSLDPCAEIPDESLLAEGMRAFNDVTKEVQERIEASHEESSQDYSILGLLVRPIQMLARYRTILQRLVDSTHETEHGYALLQEACLEAIGVCNYCNQRKREHDGALMVTEVEKKWSLTGLAGNGRHWIMDAELAILVESSGAAVETPVRSPLAIPLPAVVRRLHKCVVFLFNNLLLCIYAKERGEALLPESPVADKVYLAVDVHSIASIRPDISPPTLAQLETTEGEAPPTAHRTLSVRERGDFSIDLVFPTEAQKNLWYETLKGVTLKQRDPKQRSVIGLDLHD